MRAAAIVATLVSVAVGAGCSAREVERVIEAGGKIAYDSFKTANTPKSR